MTDPKDTMRHLRKGYEESAEFYDLFAQNDDIPLYLEYAKRCGSPILDIAAGACRVSIQLAKAGSSVTALESSLAMIAVARKRLETSPVEVQRKVALVEGDMREFNLDGKYSLIIIPASFGHALTTDEQLATLECIHRHLKDDGIFILDLFPGGIQNEHATFEESPTKMPDGRIVTRSGALTANHVTQILEMTLTFTIEYPPEDNRERETIEVVSGAALVYNREANLLLRMTGFEILDEFGDFDKRPYSADSGRRILILKKK